MTRLVCIGECMVELRGEADGRFARGFGGDTLNTAIYVAQLGVPVEYTTALGDDWGLIPARQSGGAELALKQKELAARIRGKSPAAAAEAAHRLAGTVVTYPGAIIPRTALPVTE